MAIITGASVGIGEAIARALAQELEGMAVVTDIRKPGDIRRINHRNGAEIRPDSYGANRIGSTGGVFRRAVRRS